MLLLHENDSSRDGFDVALLCCGINDFAAGIDVEKYLEKSRYRLSAVQ